MTTAGKPETGLVQQQAPAMPAPPIGVPLAFDPFQLMDRFDEDALIAEMAGRQAKALVYVVKDGGQEVAGLSKEGVDECCMALVSQGQVIREEDLEHVLTGAGENQEALFKCRASRYAVAASGEVRLDSVIGVKRQPLYYEPRALSLDAKVPSKKYRGKTYRDLLGFDEGRDYLAWMSANFDDEGIRTFVAAILNGEDLEASGTRKLNPHWYEHGAMKAARNARFRLIPGKIRAAVIEGALRMGGDKVQRAELRQGAASTTSEPENPRLAAAIAQPLTGVAGGWGGYAGRPMGEVPSEILEAVRQWALNKALDLTDQAAEGNDIAARTQVRMRAINAFCLEIIAARGKGELPEPPHKNGTPREQPAPASPAPPSPPDPAGPGPQREPGEEGDPEDAAGDGTINPNEDTTAAKDGPYAPTQKQVDFYQRLAESPVFTDEERTRALEWLATRATRQTMKDQIDWLKRQVETRRPRAAGH